MFRTLWFVSVQQTLYGRLWGKAYTSLGGLNSAHLPMASACHFSIVSATLIASSPSSSLTCSSGNLSWKRSAEAIPPNRMIAAAALEVEAPDVAVAFIMRSNIDPFVLINFSSRS